MPERAPAGSSVADLIEDLARRVGRLSPSHRDPHRFHEERSEIENDLRRLEREVRCGKPSKARFTAGTEKRR